MKTGEWWCIFYCNVIPPYIYIYVYHLVLVILWHDETRTIEEGRQVALWLGNESKFYMKKVETFITP